MKDRTKNFSEKRERERKKENKQKKRKRIIKNSLYIPFYFQQICWIKRKKEDWREIIKKK